MSILISLVLSWWLFLAAGTATKDNLPRAVDTMVINSTVSTGAQIRYKEVNICKSPSKRAKSYSGYIHLPVDSLRSVGLDQTLTINTFFWFFESQEGPETAPLTLYLNGGPGAPSTSSLLQGNGPCRVNVDSKTTRENPWSWDRVSNMVFIDQPVNTGFSYDIPAGGTVDFRGEPSISQSDFGSAATTDGRLRQSATVGIGSPDTDNAVNTTEAAMRALWLTFSIWLDGFPEYKPHQDNYEVALWTASYGGHYAPALYDFTETQNTHPQTAVHIRFASIGLMNACVDALVQLPAYPEMAFNNTYNLELINKTTYQSAKLAWDGPNGCKAQIKACRKAITTTSPSAPGTNNTINTLCHSANTFCGKHLANLISPSGRDFFDIGHASSFLPSGSPTLHTHLGYLRQSSVQSALGVPVNFTDQSLSVASAFTRTGDNLIGEYVTSLGRALDNGVKVALIYGDRDYACNWMGGEILAMALKHEASFGFREQAGYEAVELPSRGRRAYVRQHGNLSFTRVLDSGHTVNTAWPEVGFTVFNRTVSGVDVASGRVGISGKGNRDDGDVYSTKGPNSTMHIRNKLPGDAYQTEGMCYGLALSFCSNRQLNAYLKGKARVVDYWVVDYGDGTCSPNPVEPCGGRSDSWLGGVGGIWESAFSSSDGERGENTLGYRYGGWIMVTSVVVAGMVWFYFPVG